MASVWRAARRAELPPLTTAGGVWQTVVRLRGPRRGSFAAANEGKGRLPRSFSSSPISSLFKAFSPPSDGSAFGRYTVLCPPSSSSVTPFPDAPLRTVPHRIRRPLYALPESGGTEAGDGYEGEEGIGDEEKGRIDGGDMAMRVRAAARLAKEVLRTAGALAKVGTTTDEIDARLHKLIVSKGAYPSPLGYSRFPKSVCTSVNNVIAHGIPDDRPLESGDIVNVDVTVYLDGVHGDTSDSFLVGDVDERGRHLVSTTREALWAGIRACGPGRPFKDIGRAISSYAYANGEYLVNPQFTGHGIGEKFHTPPWILHHANDEPGVMRPGHLFTIEPSLVQPPPPSSRHTSPLAAASGFMWPDEWTVSTRTGARSAQAEHMVLVTTDGVEVLTA